MKEAKIQLSPAEMELMCNAEVILTKNKVVEKVKSRLEVLQMEMMAYKNEAGYSNHTLFQISPKISKGENYLGLPYLILDYPRKFAPQNIAAIRTMFWWGRFFSMTLHLAGVERTLFQRKIEDSYELLCRKDYYIGINPDPWLHHFEPDNYTQIKTMSEEAFLRHCKEAIHLKIACKVPVYLWEDAFETLLEEWKLLLSRCLN